jgi:NAD kinase
MERRTENKIVLITRRTRLDDLVARFNTVSQAKFYVEHLGADFSDYQREHQQYYQTKAETEAVLSTLGRLQTVDRSFLPNFIFGKEDTVVVLGQDGLVANTVKYSTAQPIIGVNPDPKRWDGKLLPFVVSDLSKIVPEVFSNRRHIKQVTMARAQLNNGQTLHAVNDFFIGIKSHISARYVIKVGKKQEQHSSSGIVVSTGLGSTGWFKSLMVGAVTIASKVSRQKLNVQVQENIPWDADYLYFTVREPFPSKTSATSLVFGKITEREPLVLVSQMPEAGVIFSDGIESDFLEFNSGAHATITLADSKGHLVV